MSEVEFEDTGERNSHFTSRTILGPREVPVMVRLILKLGFVKDEKSAGNFLLGLTVLGVVAAIVVFWYVTWGGGAGIVQNNLPPEVTSRFPGFVQERISQ